MTTIDREQLINSLVERTGMDRPSVAQQLEKLEARIQKAKTAEVPFEIENFGTFTTVENKLEFIPHEVLETEINNRYAGMKPIELIEAFKSPEGETVPVADSPIGQLDVKEYEKKPSDQPEDEEKKSPKEQPSTPKEESAPVTEQPQGSKTEEEPKRPEKEEVGATSTTSAPTEDQKEHTVKKAAGKNGKRPVEDPIGRTVLIIALILGLAIAGWMAYDFGFFGSEPTGNGPSDNNQQSPVEQSQGLDERPETSIAQNKGEEESSGQEELQEEERSESGNESPPASVESDEPYGLYGNIQEAAGNYYTIVVHSMQTSSQAEQKQQEVLEHGNYRTEIKEASVNGSTYYRIGIGQFETIDAAQKAAEELPEPYNSNNFISRF